MKLIKHIWYGLPFQLLLLHTKRFQVFLVFWYILFATITGNFMKSYGADALFLAPEYYNQVSAASTAIVGFALGIFIMSWNVTTFIVHGKFVSFLTTTSQPFLKYCINNTLLPLVFIVLYILKSIVFEKYQELFSIAQIFVLLLGFFGGFCLSIFISFAYFFSADKTIFITEKKDILKANLEYKQLKNTTNFFEEEYIKVSWFYSAKLSYRLPRDITHYDEKFIKKLLSKHHFSAVIAIIFSFIFLIFIGFVNDNKFFQIPAAASVLVFFALLIATIGAFVVFFKKWVFICVILLYGIINFLYKKEIIDPRNKAYGLNYNKGVERPLYNESFIKNIANKDSVEFDKKQYLKILNNWKAKQKDSLPIAYIINTSGGGLRSATFSFNVLQKIDAQLNGSLMHNTIFINGASGGMMGATYFRELFLNKKNLQSNIYVNNISADLLNPIFSSAVTRDLIGPVQSFTYNNFIYAKDRGYAFEKILNDNTFNSFNKTIADYKQVEEKALIPFCFFNSVISQDARKMIIASHSARFLMTNENKNITATSIDAIDFTSFFSKLNGNNLRLSSAIRMNATFPYALPNVWLPTSPIIDVMDAGLRDNMGTETTVKFLATFKDWFLQNTSKVVVLQLRDRGIEDWENNSSNSYLDFATKPFASMQNNIFNLQDYQQAQQLNYLTKIFENKLYTICWQYIPDNKKTSAGLSFHLTTTEKNSIKQSVNSAVNKQAFNKLALLTNTKF